jgi:hypothetical protein
VLWTALNALYSNSDTAGPLAPAIATPVLVYGMGALVTATLFNAYVRYCSRQAETSRARQATTRPITRNTSTSSSGTLVRPANDLPQRR